MICTFIEPQSRSTKYRRFHFFSSGKISFVKRTIQDVLHPFSATRSDTHMTYMRSLKSSDASQHNDINSNWVILLPVSRGIAGTCSVSWLFKILRKIATGKISSVNRLCNIFKPQDKTYMTTLYRSGRFLKCYKLN